MQRPLSAEELEEQHPDPDMHQALRRLLNVRTLLQECLIPEVYRIPAALHNAIALTHSGQKLLDVLTQREKVPYPEARVMCLLELYHRELLVDPLQTDVRGLVAAFGEQIRNLEVRYPFVFGRTLYDKAADENLGVDKSVLGSSETQDFLRGTPQGVFQVGTFVVGPYGILSSEEPRYIEPLQRVAYHCADISCDDIHPLSLSTSRDARINHWREKVRKHLDRERKNRSDFNGFLKNTNRPALPVIFDDMKIEGIAYLIGDALSPSEQECLLEWLLENPNEVIQAELSRIGLRGSARHIAQSTSAAERLQIMLLFSGSALIKGLDILANSRAIEVPYSEVRAPVINFFPAGPYGLFAELNRYGVRTRSVDINVAPLRLRRLVSDMYPLDNEPDRVELHFQLRSELADSLESKIEQYLHKRGPREAVSKLLLARHANLIVASERLGINDDLFETDEDRVNAVLWKLGFSIEDTFDVHADFWRYHRDIVEVCKPMSVSPSLVNIELIREKSGNYWQSLEALLSDSLLYSTWGLTNDHYASVPRFVYRPDVDSGTSLNLLRSHASANRALRVNLSGALTLKPLIGGFAVLADYLKSLGGREQEHRRRESDIPLWANAQKLQVFPFLHTIPFLDLLDESRERIITQLEDVTSRLRGADVGDIRNALIHPKPADVNRLRLALQAVEDVVRSLRRGGFLRQAFRPIRTEVDEAGRLTRVLADPYGDTVLINEPSPFDWLELPSPRAGVHFMAAAVFQAPSGILRFKTELTSPYSEMWREYPRRQVKANVIDSLYGQRREPATISPQRA